MKKRYDAVLCAVLGGFFGLHKFYLSERVAGILRAVFFFTLIPAVHIRCVACVYRKPALRLEYGVI